MQCPNCGYEIEKPNQKKCPCCGHKIYHEEQHIQHVPEPVQTDLPSQTASVGAAVAAAVSLSQEPKPKPPVVPEPIMVECPRCRTRIPEENNFCPRCGKNMRFEEENEPEMEKQQQKKAPDIESRNTSSSHITPEPQYNEHDDTDDIPDAILAEDPVQPVVEKVYVRQEDLDEYIEPGSYHPYPGEEDNQENSQENIPSQQDTSSSPSSTPLIIIVALVSLLFGALLYYFIA